MTGALCSVCQGKGMCGKPCPIFSKFSILGKIKEEFSGATPPSIFVGRMGYPNVFAGVLAPSQTGEYVANLDSPEKWYESNAAIEDILSFRSQMIYSRFRTSIKTLKEKMVEVQQMVACSRKPCEIEVKLEKKPSLQIRFDNYSTPIANPANVKDIKITSNPLIPIQVEKAISDIDLDTASAVNMLYEKEMTVSYIQKIFSSGLLGVKMERKLVPTRWAITATDDIISKNLMKEIRHFQYIDEYHLFTNTYLGNHYEILLMPRQWSFELIEAKFPGSVWNPQSGRIALHADYESHYPRKHYAENTVGGYYAARLAACEYLTKIKRQASVFIIRECLPEYFAPLGVWVCRETCRHAFDNKPVKFPTMEKALEEMQRRIKVPWNEIKKTSQLLRETRIQRILSEF